MKTIIFYLLLSIIFPFFIYAQDYRLTSEISSEQIKIGEKITLTTTIPGLEEVKILWEDITPSDMNVEIISKKDYYENGILHLKVIFTFFEPGKYSDFIFTIPIIDSSGELLYLETKKYILIVNGVLTDEEIAALQSIKDTTRVELKPEKPQAKFKFKISGILLVLLFLLLLLLISMVSYFFLYKALMKKKKDALEVKLPPYNKFLAQLEQIFFEEDDERNTTERRLSGLTEALKELLYGELEFNAPSETTRELIMTLKETYLEDTLQHEIYLLFNEIDMIKFARAQVTHDRLLYFKTAIGRIGSVIHDAVKAQQRLEANGQSSEQNSQNR